MTTDETLELVLGFLPSVLAVLLSVVLIMRRVGVDSVLMVIGSVLSLAIAIIWRMVWDSLIETDEFGSPDYSNIQIYQTIRSIASTVAYLLFAVGVFMLVRRHIGAGSQDVLGSGRTLTDQKEAISLANELDALYRGMVLHCVLTFVSLFVSLVLVIMMILSGLDEGAYVVVLLGALASLAFGILFTVKWCKLHYRHWRVAIEQTGFNEFSAGEAVGFLFIPLFNLYWMFRAYVTLSELLYKAGMQPKYSGRTPLINTGTSRTLCVLNIFTIVPYVGALLSLVNIFVWFNVHAQHKRTVTYMLRAETTEIPN